MEQTGLMQVGLPAGTNLTLEPDLAELKLQVGII